MPEIGNFILSLKLTWIKRLSTAHERPWGKLFQTTYGAIHNIYNFGPNWGLAINRNLPNKFWEEVFSAWNETYNQIKEKSKTDVLSTPLWYNNKIGLGNIYEKSWFNNGISIIGDIVDDNMNILNREILEQKFGFRIRNFLLYYRIRSEINKYIQKIRKTISPDQCFSRPLIPHHIRLITRCKQGCRYLYKKLTEKPVETKYKTKWNEDLNLNIDEHTWKRVYTVTFNTVPDNSLIWLQYRIIHRILGTAELLNKMSIQSNALCRMCNSAQETLVHLFIQCEHVKTLWKNLENWILFKVGLNLTFSRTDIFLGYLYNDNNSVPINTIIISAKDYIFYCARNRTIPVMLVLKEKIKTKYIEQTSLFTEDDKLEKLHKSWISFSKLFN